MPHSPIIPNISGSFTERYYSGIGLVSLTCGPLNHQPQEISAMTVITIGKRLVPAEQVAFVEPFDPSSNPEFKPEKDFKGRVVLLNREVLLTEQTAQEFAAEHKLHLFPEDSVAVNQSIRFKIEIFEPTENFKPTKPYKTRLKWSDLAGEEQSKLLVTAPETVIAEILQAKVETPAAPAKRSVKRPARGRNGSRRMEGYRS
jgi:hypothetical protein